MSFSAFHCLVNLWKNSSHGHISSYMSPMHNSNPQISIVGSSSCPQWAADFWVISNETAFYATMYSVFFISFTFVWFCVSELSLRAINLNICYGWAHPTLWVIKVKSLSNSLKILWVVTGESSFVSLASKLNNSPAFYLSSVYFFTGLCLNELS